MLGERSAERAVKAQQVLVEARAAGERANEERKRAEVAQRARALAAAAAVPGSRHRAGDSGACEEPERDKRNWRRTAVMKALMPKGAENMGTFPRREEERFGEETGCTV